MGNQRNGGSAAWRGIWLGLALSVAMSSAQAAPSTGRERLAQLLKAPPAEQAQAREIGRKVALFCVNCHGPGTAAEMPGLAGQNPFYFLNQFDAFRSGRRAEAFMQGLAKVLSVEEKAGVALFYADLPVMPRLPGDAPRAAEGRGYFQRACVRCHGANARGGENFPRLAGQHPEYLRKSLLRYLRNDPGRNYPPMTVAVTALGEQNIEAVVAYLAGLE